MIESFTSKISPLLFSSNWICEENRSFNSKNTNLLIVVEIVDELIEALSWFHCNKHVKSVGTERYRLRLSSSSVNDGRLGSGKR